VVENRGRIRIGAVAATVLFLAAGIALTAVTHDPWPTDDGLTFVVLTAYGAVGYVIARAEPRNPIGWIFLALGLFTLFDYVMRLYLVLDYREHGGRLPLGHAVEFWRGSWGIFPLLLALPAIALFPDGRLSPRWRRFMWIYAAAAVLFVATQVTGQIVQNPARVLVDVRGNLSNNDGGLVAAVGWFLGPFFLLAWCSFVWRQIKAWRSAAGIQRDQLKWLAAGSAVLVVSCVALVVFGDGSSLTARITADIATIGIGVMPVAVGVAILRFRLYEIDRLISRTLSYALLTGLLVAVFGGIVLRRRVQRLVDHRFNRARYDRDALVARFGARLRDAVDSDTVVAELTGAAARSVEPAHISVWVRS
jgi:hypothetical protein